jgi:hypothetical protein
MADLLHPEWLCLPGCGIATRPTRAIDAAGLPPAGLQPCRLLTRQLSPRRPTASLRFLPPYPAPAPAEPCSQTLSHDSKTQCSAGKVTPGAAAEPCWCQDTASLPVRYVMALSKAVLMPDSALASRSDGYLTGTCGITSRPPRAASDDPRPLQKALTGKNPTRSCGHRMRPPPAPPYPLERETLTSPDLRGWHCACVGQYNACRIGVRSSVEFWRRCHGRQSR